jgi:hypothetical protein
MYTIIMQSNKWGGHAWEFYHTVTFNYPISPTIEDQKNIKGMFDYLGPNLPCSICKESFAFFYKYIPIDDFLSDRYGVVYWLYSVHTLVNHKLNQPNISFSTVIRKYEALRVSNEEPVTNEYVTMFIEMAKNKYQNIMTNKIAKMLKENKDKKEVVNIINDVIAYS